MSTAETVSKFAQMILKAYPPYRWEEAQEDIWTASLSKRLYRFSDAIIEKALDKLLGERDATKTPTVRECIDMCEDVKRYAGLEEKKGELPIEEKEQHPLDAFSPERKAFARSLMRTPLGKQAAREGWAGPLRTYIRKTGEMPRTDAEKAQLKRTTEETLALHKELMMGKFIDKDGIEQSYDRSQRTIMLKCCETIFGKWKDAEKEAQGRAVSRETYTTRTKDWE